MQGQSYRAVGVVGRLWAFLSALNVLPTSSNFVKIRDKFPHPVPNTVLILGPDCSLSGPGYFAGENAPHI